MAGVWEMFGVNALDIWDLPVTDFFGMTDVIDQARRDAKASAGKG
jgi:hypothetical protein